MYSGSYGDSSYGSFARGAGYGHSGHSSSSSSSSGTSSGKSSGSSGKYTTYINIALAILAIVILLFLIGSYYNHKANGDTKSKKEGFLNPSQIKGDSGAWKAGPLKQQEKVESVQPSHDVNKDEVFASVPASAEDDKRDAHPAKHGPAPANEGAPATTHSDGNQFPTDTYPKDTLSSAELLPHDKNSKWAQVNPAGQGELGDQNFLEAGFHIGTNTIGQTLRNPNLQLRSEPPNPQMKVSPWMQSTMEADTNRRGLEIGGGGGF